MRKEMMYHDDEEAEEIEDLYAEFENELAEEEIDNLENQFNQVQPNLNP